MSELNILGDAKAMKVLRSALKDLNALGVPGMLAPMSLPHGMSISLHAASSVETAVAANVASTVGGEYAGLAETHEEFKSKVAHALASPEIVELVRGTPDRGQVPSIGLGASDRFGNLRDATRACIEQLGASRNEELFEFRNAATFTIVHELLQENDSLKGDVAVPVATHSFGTLSAAEAALLQSFRQADKHGKAMIETAADVAAQVAVERETKQRCEVVDLESARSPKG